jgi:hypothetical protein
MSGSQRQGKAISGNVWQSLATDRGDSGKFMPVYAFSLNQRKNTLFVTKFPSS